MEAWTDERLDDLAATLRPVPAEVARIAEALDRLIDETRSMRADLSADTRTLRDDLSADTRSLRADLSADTRSLRADLSADMRSLRGDLSASQRQITQIGWALAAALVGTIVALLVTLI